MKIIGKYRIITTLCLLLCSTLLWGKGVEVLPKQLNLGLVTKKVESSFMLYNNGLDAVVVVRIEAGCKCTKVQRPKKPIAPGDSVALKLSYTPQIGEGVFYKTIKIYTTAMDEPIEIIVRGTNRER